MTLPSLTKRKIFNTMLVNYQKINNFFTYSLSYTLVKGSLTLLKWYFLKICIFTSNFNLNGIVWNKNVFIKNETCFKSMMSNQFIVVRGLSCQV